MVICGCRSGAVKPPGPVQLYNAPETDDIADNVIDVVAQVKIPAAEGVTPGLVIS